MRKRFALVPIVILGVFFVFMALSVQVNRPIESLAPILFSMSMIWILAFVSLWLFLRILPYIHVYARKKGLLQRTAC